MGTGHKLLFIVADRLSALAAKGEITARYYNPGECFDEVHLLTTSNDCVDPALIAKTAGRARVHVHRLWRGPDLANMALSPLLKGRWGAQVVKLARELGISLVRTGDRLTAHLGHCVKEGLGIPHIVSLHTHRDDLRRRTPWGARRLMMEVEGHYARRAISRADAVIVVYESIRDYALKCGARRVERIYNVISPECREGKSSYALSRPPRIVSVGRQMPRKVPDQLVLAMRQVDAELTLVGDGPSNARLRALVAAEGLENRVHFRPSVANDELCATLADFDIFAAHTHFPEFPKTVMEALWRGVPVVINEDQSLPVPELQGEWVCRVKNAAEDYARALRELLADAPRRAALGRRGRHYAESAFDPAATEAKLADLYGEFLGRKARVLCEQT